ncbi:MAG: PAS domain S-box protein, partial [Bacteroidales bacterium]
MARHNNPQAGREALRKSEAIKNTMVSNIGDVIVIIDQNGINKYKSPNVTKLFGWKPEELIGKNTWDNVHPDDLEAGQKFIGTIAAVPNATGTTEVRYKRKDGEYVWIEISLINLLHDKDIQGILGNYRDITERRQAEKAIAVNGKMLDDILDNTRIHLWAFNGTHYIYTNKEWFDFTGQDPNLNLTIERWASVVHPDDQVSSGEIWMKNWEAKTGHNNYFRLLRHDGVYRDFFCHAVPIYDNEGKFQYFQGFNFDITERKQAEKELILAKEAAEENEQKYRMLFDSNKDNISILGIGTDGKPSGFIEFNPAACQMFGFSREELLLKKLEELEAPVPENVMVQRLETLKAKGSVEFETIIRDKAGDNIDVEVKVILINYQNQPALMNITKNITERKKAEQQLIAAKEHAENNNRINEARLKLIQFSENHTIDEVLEETLNSAEIISQSKIGFVHFVEQDQTNLLLQNWSTGTKQYYCNAKGMGFHYPIDKAGVWVDCVTERKPVIHNNYEALKHKKGLPEGHAALIRELVVPIIYDGNVKAIFGIGNKETDYNQIDVENISLLAYLAWEIVEKKKISEALVIAKENAEESDRLKSAFLTNMSHEIRTPMNGILGFAELLKTPDLSGELQMEYVKIIEKSGKRMLNIINDIVDISKIEAGLMKLDIKDSNINEQVEYIYTFFKPEVEAKGMKLLFNTTLPAKEATIKTDREKVYAILTNLVKNAIKYTQTGIIVFGYGLEHKQGIASLQFYV